MGGIRNKPRLGKVIVKNGTKEDYEVFEHMYIKMLVDHVNREMEKKSQ
ncbi:hypothetical protein [Priestia filamentosa]|nr:hypothetical protein [Priestia filamentosa]